MTAGKIDGRKGSEIYSEGDGGSCGLQYRKNENLGRNKTLARISEHGRRLVNRGFASQTLKVMTLLKKTKKVRD